LTSQKLKIVLTYCFTPRLPVAFSQLALIQVATGQSAGHLDSFVWRFRQGEKPSLLWSQLPTPLQDLGLVAAPVRCCYFEGMNLRRLQYFINVVDCGTVTAAAEKLHIAQPALSRQLKTLERELRLELFETRGNRLMLTSSGRAFVPMARKLIVQARDLTKSVEVLRTGMVHRLSCAATAASLRGFLAHFIANLGPDEPTIVAREAGHFGLEYELDDDLDFIITPTVP